MAANIAFKADLAGFGGGAAGLAVAAKMADFGLVVRCARMAVIAVILACGGWLMWCFWTCLSRFFKLLRFGRAF